MPPKAWYCSRTILFNVIVLVVMLLSAAEPLLPGLQGVLPPQLYAWAAFALPLVNMALRFITSGPVGYGLRDDDASTPPAPPGGTA